MLDLDVRLLEKRAMGGKKVIPTEMLEDEMQGKVVFMLHELI